MTAVSKKRIKEMQQPNLAEAVLPLAVAEIEAGGVGTAGLSSRSVDGFTESYEEFISQRLSEPVPTAKVFLNGITPWKKKEESSEAAEPTAQEQVKALLESPHTPDCVRWNFIAGILEEFLLRDWVKRSIEPRSDFIEAIQAIKQLANDKITFRELRERRGRLRIVLPYDSPCSARYVSHSYRYKVPYEWQLAHLRDLIAEHSKRRLPLLLCLKERAQRIKQAPSYGQQLEEVLYAS